MRSRTLTSSLLALALVLPASAVGAIDAVSDLDLFSAEAEQMQAEGIGTDNFTLLKNLPHSEGGRGSDIEFISYSYADAAEAAAAGFTVDPAADALPSEPGIQKDVALAGTTGARMYLYDVTDPANAYEAAVYNCPANQGDSQIFSRDGRTYATYTVEDSSAGGVIGSACATDAGLIASGSGTFIIDVTNPFAPAAVAHIPVPEGSHNGTVHPSGDYFYNSNSSLWTDTAFDGGAGIEYYDISDFSQIKRLGRLFIPPVPASLGTESHDITFNADGSRAYSAALSQGLILDTSNPAEPSIISRIIDPAITVWHQSDPITVGGRDFLVIEDEVAGATPTGQCPNGGVHVYETTGPMELAPVKVGYWNIDEVRVTPAEEAGGVRGCTAHVFRLYPDANVMTISYYNGGVRVVDLNGLAGVNVGGQGLAGVTVTVGGVQDPMVQIGYRRFADSNSWAAKSPRISRDADGNLEPFEVFSNGGRGLDVLAFAGEADAQAMADSEWLTPAQAEAELPRYTLAELTARPEFVCFL